MCRHCWRAEQRTHAGQAQPWDRSDALVLMIRADLRPFLRTMDDAVRALTPGRPQLLFIDPAGRAQDLSPFVLDVATTPDGGARGATPTFVGVDELTDTPEGR